jgi:hypothetical protein
MCVSYVYNFGVRNNHGVGKKFTRVNVGDPWYWEQLIYETSFWVIISLITRSIVFGVIISAFTGLSDDATAKEEESKNVCFVCGLVRADFSRAGKDFDLHLTKEHNPWLYFSYIHYLNLKDPGKLQATELYCHEQFLEVSDKWVPKKNSNFLKYEKRPVGPASSTKDSALNPTDQVSLENLIFLGFDQH